MAEIPAQEAQQPTVTALPDQLWDVVIIGAGPAGSMSGFFLARDGHRVLLIDKERFPREKVCGDFLFTDTIRLLRKIGFLGVVQKIAHEVKSIVVYSPSGISLDIPGDYLTIRRAGFDQLLVNRAVEVGVTFAHGKVCGIETGTSNGITISLKEPAAVIRARICVLATGANTTLPNRMGLVSRQRPSAVAARCYVRSKVNLDHVILSYDRSLIPGYGWVIPLGHNEFNVGCGARYGHLAGRKRSLKKTFAGFLSDFPPARQLIEAGEIISSFRGAALRCGLSGMGAVTQEGVIAVGETIGTTLPFTGEGIGTAIESGEMAAAVISEALRDRDIKRLQEFPGKLVTEMKPRYQGYNVAERWLSHRWLNDLIVWRISKSRFLHAWMLNSMFKAGSAWTVYAPLRILQSFWK